MFHEIEGGPEIFSGGGGGKPMFHEIEGGIGWRGERQIVKIG